MLKIAILSDGPYGDRAYETINQVFETKFIRLKPPNDCFADDEIELSKEIIEDIESSDMIISYISHPDLILDIVNKFSEKVDCIIVASWKGKGFKNQLENKENVLCPEIMCEIDNLKGSDNISYNEFIKKIGKPIIEFTEEDGKLKDAKVIRSSPCGSTSFVAEFITNKYKDQNFNEINIDELAQEGGLKIQIYPCRAGKIRLFSDEESKKVMASTVHSKAIKNAIKIIKNKQTKIQ